MVSWILGFLVSKFIGFRVCRFLGLLVSWFNSFNELFDPDSLSYSLGDIDLISKIFRNLLNGSSGVAGARFLLAFPFELLIFKMLRCTK